MFTGIIQGFFPISAIEQQSGLTAITVELNKELINGVEIGASVAVNGVCLTVTAIDAKGLLSFDIIEQTQNMTNLKYLELGDMVNIERSLTFGDEIGGHLLSGHIDGTAKITQIEKPVNNFVITILPPKELSPYLFSKGFIGLNGASLTIAEKNNATGEVDVHLIPETLRLTTFKQVHVGDYLNVEIDRQTQVIVDTVENYLKNQRELGN